MITINTQVKVYLYSKSIDMRKQLDTLLMLIKAEIGIGVQEKILYIFYNKGQDKIKGVLWDGNGFIMIYKRLETDRFCFNEVMEDLELSQEQFKWLLSGFDFIKMNKNYKLNYQSYY